MAYAEARLAEILDEMEQTLQDRPWLNGDRMSLADCSVAPFIERFESNKLERLVDWKARPGAGRVVGADAGHGGLPHRPFLQGALVSCPANSCDKLRRIFVVGKAQ